MKTCVIPDKRVNVWENEGNYIPHFFLSYFKPPLRLNSVWRQGLVDRQTDTGSIDPCALKTKTQQLHEIGSDSMRMRFLSCSPVRLGTSERSFLGENDNSFCFIFSVRVCVCARVHVHAACVCVTTIDEHGGS